MDKCDTSKLAKNVGTESNIVVVMKWNFGNKKIECWRDDDACAWMTQAFNAQRGYFKQEMEPDQNQKPANYLHIPLIIIAWGWRVRANYEFSINLKVSFHIEVNPHNFVFTLAVTNICCPTGSPENFNLCFSHIVKIIT